MLPPKDDPRWMSLVVNQDELPLQALASKMIITRVRHLVGGNPSSEKMGEAVTIAYEFFKKNEHAVSEDIKCIFGRGS
ncbi:hypothetical protein AZI85_10770 [Bdellovibrio bacteriovorus]|uniref:Uncharacterized protein n=1 Tax=Bdellovibrio bacteriovorus TaxID=959 RepID=A0A150WDL7_BDEBC|nr:hypothetical protein [Bdellovibrio bacteriovorus]KYG60928.1 hypothetical protein AZI85_10770 [Bdellovibrio bacteriovorus]